MLDGIIEGIYCDVSMNKQEMLFLDTWLLQFKSSIPFNEQSSHIYELTKTLTEGILSFDDKKLDNKVIDTSLELLEQIQCEIADIAENLIVSSYSELEFLINYFQGLCKGIMADSVIGESEVMTIDGFLYDYQILRSDPFIKVFYDFFDEVDTKNLTSEMYDRVKNLICDYSGSSEYIVEGASLGLAFFDKVENLDLNGKAILLTGKFKLGTRKKCTEIALQQGAIVLSEWRSDIDYLIVGSSSSRDWIYQSYGRKIEEAKRQQVERGHKVKIITEDDWNI